MVGTALGMMAMPQAVRILLEEYNFHGSLLILGGFALHALVGSMLLQPVEWHVRPEELKEEKDEQLENKTEKQVNIFIYLGLTTPRSDLSELHDLNGRDFTFSCYYFPICEVLPHFGCRILN
jgi:hypothetical protein